tara:strand:- start:70 stop:1065 length:996 start_codon:yes stop_codon:yes gene_type:complete
MIYKSYLVEDNLDLINKNINLFYGENIGLKNQFKDIIKDKFKNKNYETLNFDQEQILKNLNILTSEINNKSLFGNKKIIFINNVNDKIFNFIEEISSDLEDISIYLFAELLEKKSKIRNFFESSEKFGIIPCYEDNDISVKKLINKKLVGFTGLSSQNINLILNNTNSNRSKVLNEINKIINYFTDKKIITEKLEQLLDPRINENFNSLRDNSLAGNKKETNKLLGDTIIEEEKNVYYLNIINQRLIIIKKINEQVKGSNYQDVINSIKPAIFWKDKPTVLIQAQKWNLDKLKKILYLTNSLEITIKSNSMINKNVLMKKLIIDICQTANS